MPVGDPITTLEQLAQDLSSMRRRHAAEIASFLKRIDPVLLENQYSEDLMQPLTLSLVEKQQQTQHLLSVLGVPIPNTDQNTDQLIKDLENERKLAQEAIAQRAMELINIKSRVKAETIDAAVQTDIAANEGGLDINNIKIQKKTTYGRWSPEETEVIQKCLPIFGQNYEEYLKVFPYMSLDRIRRKAYNEHLHPTVNTWLPLKQSRASSVDDSQAPSQAEGSQEDVSSEGSDSEEELKWQAEKRLRPRKQVHYIVEPIRSPSPKRSRGNHDGSSSDDEPDSSAGSSDN